MTQNELTMIFKHAVRQFSDDIVYMSEASFAELIYGSKVYSVKRQTMV